MKELSIEEKACRYDEALEKLRSLHDDYDTVSTLIDIKEELENIFPELVESEDELTWLTKYIEEEAYSLSMDIRDDEDRIKLKNLQRSLAWLKRQGGQKPIDKVEPKFKVGDFIVDYYCRGRVVKLTDDAYLLDTGQGIPFSCEHNAHLWTIEDAKDGDVIYLPNGNNEYYFFIFKGIENAAVMSFAHFYQYSDGTSEVEGTSDNLTSIDDVFQPATKEQRDFLFQKMEEAGYEWDAEKKELKKIDPCETCDHPILNCQNFPCELKRSEQKPTDWSEEDERAIGIIKIALEHPYDMEGKWDRKFALNWLNSIKDRVQPQPKQEWSEEDERMRRLIISHFKQHKLNHEYITTDDKVIKWLNSLKKSGTK